MRQRDLGLVALVALLGFFSLYPLGMLLFGSIHSAPPGLPGSFTLGGYLALFSDDNAKVVWNTLTISLVKTVLSLGLAMLLAWIVARTDTPARGTLEVLITLPFFIPPILTATAWGMLGNPKVGSLNLAWGWLTGLQEPLINMYSYGGVVWHMMQYSAPFLFLLLVDALRAMDPSLEESSRMSGATRFQTFFRVTLILMLPVTTNAFILSFIRGIEAFESPVFFGTPAGIEMLSTRIYHLIHHQAQPAYQAATALGFAAMLLMFILIVWQWRILKGRAFYTVSGRGYAPALIRLGWLRWPAFALCALFVFVTVVLPVGQLVLSSFFRYFGVYKLEMLTLEHYRSVWASRDFWRAFGNTMVLGLSGATATMVLGGAVAYVSVRTRWRGRRLIEVLAWLPWMMPGIVLGLGFLWGFAMLPAAISIYGTMWALLLAYVALGTPLAVRVMSGSYAQLSYDLEESSRVHGASLWQTFWRILVALAWPAFSVGWVLTFFAIMRELSASILLYSVGTEVLSVVMLKMWTGGEPEQVSVIAILMLAMVLMFRWVQLGLLKRKLNAL